MYYPGKQGKEVFPGGLYAQLSCWKSAPKSNKKRTEKWPSIQQLEVSFKQMLSVKK